MLDCNKVKIEYGINVECCPSCHRDAEEGYGGVTLTDNLNQTEYEICCILYNEMRERYHIKFPIGDKNDIL